MIPSKLNDVLKCELIDTWWDVNMHTIIAFVIVVDELIDTWWDVNLSGILDISNEV